ncbi:MAG: hypothetical protein KC620_08265 [Myxococcales bacterium]|nr:hypothetical protein [Myxococcales bacterium]
MGMQDPISLTLGPADIVRIGDAVEQLMPWLSRSRFRLLPDGNLEFSESEPADAVRLLRGAVEQSLPETLRGHLGRSSGLGWNVFFGHVVGFWLGQRRRMGFLRALTDRASVHGLDLQLHWNEGRFVEPLRSRPGPEALWAGGAVGLVGGLAATRFWPADPVRALLVAGIGLVLGRLYQRIATRRRCGDRLCRAPLGRRPRCPSCGAITR